MGSEIVTFVNNEKPISNYEVELDATDLISGVYFYSLHAGDFIDTKNLPAGRQGWSSFDKSTVDKCC